MLDKERGLYVAHSANGPISLIGKMANRHGLIAGATGTGKTVTLQVLAETFCQAGVPCFMADMKGDLSGISQVGRLSGFIQKRLPEFGIEDPQFQSCPVRFFDVYGEEACGTTLKFRIFDTEFGHTLFDETRHFACLADAGKVALHIRHKAGYARLAETFSEDL